MNNNIQLKKKRLTNNNIQLNK